MIPELLTISEAAKVLRLSESGLKTRLWNGMISVVRVFLFGRTALQRSAPVGCF